MENQERAEEGICILSFDGGGPGTMSQLRMVDEFMMRLAYERDVDVEELRPANYFDMMGGVGFGGLAALLLGRLRMTTNQAMKELSLIGTTTFPNGNETAIPEVNMARLRQAIESMLQRNGHSVDMKLRDDPSSKCKVVVLAAFVASTATTAVTDRCQPFRTYRSPRKCLNCTLVEAACAVMATPGTFSPIAIGPPLRKQSFAGIPHGFDNPTREVLKEAKLIFGENKPVSLFLSLGSGQRATLSDPNHITRQSRIHCDTVARELQDQLCGIGEYLRLNVDRGMEHIGLGDWQDLGLIETHTDLYLELAPVIQYIDEACQWLLKRNGSVTLGQLCGGNSDCVAKYRSKKLDDYIAMRVKQVQDIVAELRIERITLVDAIGNNILISLEFCLTYAMLSDMIEVYFKHHRLPGSDFVERGDYRLVHGTHRNILGPLEWSRIDKPGLKVEMSIVLRTRNEDKARCPRCRTWSEGKSIDGWAQCLSCLGQFQIETQIQNEAEAQVETEPQSEDASQPEDRHTNQSSIVTPGVRESKSSTQNKPPMTKAMNREEGQLQFRLISVINLLSHNERIRRIIGDLLLQPNWRSSELPEETCRAFNAVSLTYPWSFECSLTHNSEPCFAKFTRADRFRHHLQGHLGIRPYPCADKASEGACDARFTSIAARDQHVRNKKLIVCICEAEIHPKNLSRHLRSCPGRPSVAAEDLTPGLRRRNRLWSSDEAGSGISKAGGGLSSKDITKPLAPYERGE